MLLHFVAVCVCVYLGVCVSICLLFVWFVVCAAAFISFFASNALVFVSVGQRKAAEGCGGQGSELGQKLRAEEMRLRRYTVSIHEC